MAGFVQNLLQDAAGAFFGSDYLRDYTHASKTFRTNNYQNAPKLKFLYHTYFDINPDAFVGYNSRSVGTVGPSTNFGLLVKEIKLPTYSFNTVQLNQYNRKRIIQTKIKYDPIDVTFHDDNGDQVNQLWEAYYNYYYNDGLKPNVQFGGSRGAQGQGPNNYNERNIYNLSITGDDDWGYNAQANGGGNVKVPFFKSITVFGFNQHNFTAYTLINPVITSFSHDTYNYNEGNGIMSNRMNIDYETVVYNYGAVDGRDPGNIVTGFGDQATYDRNESPISKLGANGTILGQGGLVDAAGGTLDALARGDLLGAVKTAGTAYNTFKNTNIKQVAAAELTAMLRNSVTNTPNTRNTLFDFPSAGSTPGPLGTAGAPPIGTRNLGNGSGQPVITGEPLAGQQFNGQDLSTGPRFFGEGGG
jgi:hypothetical protein